MSESINKEPNTHLEEKDRRFKETWHPRLSLIVSAVAIVLSVFTLISKETGSISDFIMSIRSKGYIQVIINIGNILTALIAFIYIARKSTASFNIQNPTKFKSLAESEHEGDDLRVHLGNIKNRVEKLVNQYRFQMTLLAFSFVLLYGGILLAPDYDRQHISFFPIAINLLNLLGALFVYLGFSVLHNKTLDAEKVPTGTTENPNKNKPQYLNYNSSLYWGGPVLFMVCYILVFIVRALAYKADYEPTVEYYTAVEHFLNIFDLLAGLANGLAMSLLFGKYVSIEYALGQTESFRNVFENILYPFSKMPYRAIASFGIIFILPIYALAQPLFGSLEIDVFGNPHRFQTIVYAICLFGKMIFFHLTYLLISKKLLHLYLYGMVSEIGNFKELEACFRIDKKELDAGASKPAAVKRTGFASRIESD